MSVERSASGLRDMLFDLLDDVRAGKVTHRQAKLQCEIAGRIIDTGRLELQTIQAARQGLELTAALEALPPARQLTSGTPGDGL